MKKILLLFLILLASCTLNKVVKHHGVHNLEKKQEKLKMNITNKNEILKIMGPPSTESFFENDVYIFIERKTSSSKITKLGKKELLINNVLVLEIDKRGLLADKKFYNKEEMNKINFSNQITEANYSKKSFIYSFLYSLRQKVDDPLGKKRVKN